jgi:hypothetical protein
VAALLLGLVAAIAKIPKHSSCSYKKGLLAYFVEFSCNLPLLGVGNSLWK